MAACLKMDYSSDLRNCTIIEMRPINPVSSQSLSKFIVLWKKSPKLSKNDSANPAGPRQRKFTKSICLTARRSPLSPSPVSRTGPALQDVSSESAAASAFPSAVIDCGCVRLEPTNQSLPPEFVFAVSASSARAYNNRRDRYCVYSLEKRKWIRFWVVRWLT